MCSIIQLGSTIHAHHISSHSTWSNTNSSSLHAIITSSTHLCLVGITSIAKLLCFITLVLGLNIVALSISWLILLLDIVILAILRDWLGLICDALVDWSLSRIIDVACRPKITWKLIWGMSCSLWCCCGASLNMHF